MKTPVQKSFIPLAFLLYCLAGASLKAVVTFTTSFPAISNTYSGTLTLQISGLTSGDTVVVRKFLDANTNNVVDAGDLLIQQFQLTDGVVGTYTNGATTVTNFNVPGDLDGAANG